MSTSHSAAVFFGTWTPLDSKAGQVLAEYVEGYGCLPCRVTGTPGVVIDRCGSAPTGDEQMAVYADASALRYSPRENTPKPRPIGGIHEGMAVAAILDALQRHGIKPIDMAPIGWHFAARAD